MLKTLRIKNFQKHQDFKLKFDPHVTTIIGPSDIGKSAILRAIMWVVLNKPRGASFLRTGADTVSVSLKLKGHKITRARGKTNTYHLDKAKFAAFGNGVPEEISSILNMDETINFQDQHLGCTFWFRLSPGEVSKQLNQIVDLSVIDTTLSNIAGEMRKARMESTIVESRLEAARKDRAKLRTAKQADRALQTVEERQLVATAKGERVTALKALLQKAATHRGHLDRLLQALTEARQVDKLGQAWYAAEYRRARLVNIVHNLNAEKMNASRKIPKTKKLQNLYDDWAEVSAKVRILHDLVTEHHRLTELRNVARITAETTESKIHREIGPICPLCGNMTQS